jgi:hypothetical protein
MRGIQGRRNASQDAQGSKHLSGSAAGSTTAPDQSFVSKAATITTPMLPWFVTASGQGQPREQGLPWALALVVVVLAIRVFPLDRWLAVQRRDRDRVRAGVLVVPAPSESCGQCCTGAQRRAAGRAQAVSCVASTIAVCSLMLTRDAEGERAARTRVTAVSETGMIVG